MVTRAALPKVVRWEEGLTRMKSALRDPGAGGLPEVQVRALLDALRHAYLADREARARRPCSNWRGSSGDIQSAPPRGAAQLCPGGTRLDSSVGPSDRRP